MKSNTQSTQRPLYQKILMVAALICTVGGTLTAIMTYMNVGLTDTFLNDWLKSFVVAMLLMIPIGFLFITLTSKLVQLIIPNSKIFYQQLISGILMAFIMESLLATSTTAMTTGFIDKSTFINAWSQAFITALPFGLIMALSMSLFLKPKLKQFMQS